MRKENLSTSMAKLVIVVSLIVGIGAIFGAVGYYWTINNIHEKSNKEEITINGIAGIKQILPPGVFLIFLDLDNSTVVINALTKETDIIKKTEKDYTKIFN